jgi:alkylation response protein AidB-like acyl-CoA dehydrogenase
VSVDLLAVDRSTPAEQLIARVRSWVEGHVPDAWRTAAAEGGPRAVRRVRARADYESWYPTFARSGLAVATWPVAYGGLDLTAGQARLIDAELADLNLGRLNPLGLNLAAPALFAHGTEEQRLRYLLPIVHNEERWCQLFSEPGAGSDLASLATRATRDGDSWVFEGQKVWTTWAHVSDYAVVLARTDTSVPKRQGITYFLLPLHQDGVKIRPLRGMHGDVDFNEVFLDGARTPDANRVGAVGDGWRVAGATLSGERQMVAGSGSGGVDKIGGAGVDHLRAVYARRDVPDPAHRQRLAGLVAEDRVRQWTNERVRASGRAGRPVGAVSSVGKVHQSQLNQRMQLLAVDLLGLDGVAWAGEQPFETGGMLRSRANTIEGGTTEVNRTVIAERVLGLPREPDPWHDAPWSDVPR